MAFPVGLSNVRAWLRPLWRSEAWLLDWESNLLCDAGTVLGVDLVEVLDDALLDVTAALAEAA